MQEQEGPEQHHDAANSGGRRMIEFAQPLVLVLVAEAVRRTREPR